MNALHLYAGPAARAHIEAQGLAPADISVVAAAAGGPKGLILGPLDRHLFGQWLPQSTQAVDLIGASIGGWRMAAACLPDPVAAFDRLAHDYIHQNYQVPPGQQRVTAGQISREFAASLQTFFGGHEASLVRHPRYRLHLIVSRGLRCLQRETPWTLRAGMAGAYLSNAWQRQGLGRWLERTVFSAAPPGAALATGAASAASALEPGLSPDAIPDTQPDRLPFDTRDYPTRRLALDARNFQAALQASCAIPFVLRGVQDIPGAPPGAYWDGGLTDYHLHLHYQPARQGLVLYPHFQRQLVPGWLDKAWPWRHAATPALDRVLVLAPNPDWVRTLPGGKLPDRTDFVRFDGRLAERVRVWQQAVRQAQQLLDEWQDWLHSPKPAARLLPL